jgi:hypothetical protein
MAKKLFDLTVITDGYRGEAGRVATVARCRCGGEVHLSSNTNECSRCDKCYNMSGQQLAPRSQWGS